jgi:hypothetical protein
LRGAYGSPRIFKQLKALGFKTSRATVERLMRESAAFGRSVAGAFAS